MAGTLKVGTITTPSGSGTITIPSGVTLSGGGLANTPAFSVYLNATSAGITSATWTKVSSWTEQYDTDGAFASDKFTVPSGSAGKYMFSTQTRWNVSGSTSNVVLLKLTINGLDPTPVKIITRNFCNGSGNAGSSANGIYDLSAGDYVEVYVYQNITTANLLANETFFQGYKIIGA